MGSKQRKRLPEKQSIFVKDFYPRTEKQEQLINLIENKEVVIAKGLAGSGKTFVTLATALNLLGGTYKKIILVKSVTSLPGEEIGFIKGGIEQKMEPTMMSFMWNIDKLCGPGAAEALLDKKLIQVLPLAFIRGLSIDNSIVIVDEVQNIDKHTFKTIMTRIGEDSKYIFLGDSEQVDRKHKEESCLNKIMEIFADNDLIGTIEFTDEDCVRNPIIPKILAELRANNM